MPGLYEIRADYDRDSIVIYQAYPASIAEPALKAQKFVAPFSFGRMTWIKPSFLWLMHRSNWGQKSGQEMTLRVRIKRHGWETALKHAVLTSCHPEASRSKEDWERQFHEAFVHVQWDPERSLRGAALPHYSIQVGISRHLIREFVDDWIVKIEDFSGSVAKMRKLLRDGKANDATRHLPQERVYNVPSEIGPRILM